MRVAIYGATGMIGQGVLRECLLDPGVLEVVAIGRRASGVRDPKLRELTLQDMEDYDSIRAELVGFDACFFCLGVSSTGMSEADYTKVTHDYALAAANALSANNPLLTFVFVSGMGTDSSERGRVMWARVKGKAENALLAMPFKAVYTFRPGLVEPVHGELPRGTSIRVLYTLMKPFVPVIRLLFPRWATTTERVGRAMLRVAREGAPRRILEAADIDQLGRGNAIAP